MSKDNLTKRQLIIIDDDKPTTNYNVKLAEQTDCFTDVVSFNSAETAIIFLLNKKKATIFLMEL